MMNKYFYILCVVTPLFFSTVLSLLVIDYPAEFTLVPYTLLGMCLAGFVVFFLRKDAMPQLHVSDIIITTGLKRFLILFYAGVITFCVLDLAVHGLVLFSDVPGAYMTFAEIEKRIRHISMLIWTLAPVSFLFRSHLIKLISILISVTFLALFLVRGQILISFASMVIMLILFDDIVKNKIRRVALMAVLTVVGLSLFSVLGKYRAGANDNSLIYSLEMGNTQERMDCNFPESIPMSDYFKDTGVRTKWLLTYVAVPIFNLSTTEACRVRDKYSLLSQILPSWLSRGIQVAPVPLVSPNLNVGTEFLPFVLFSGVAGIFAAFITAILILVFFVNLFVRDRNIFYLLIILKLSATLVFLNFAVQFYIWTNFGFVILMLFLKWFYQSRGGQWLVSKTGFLGS